ncbi:unnamed protein product [Caretta caretta]
MIQSMEGFGINGAICCVPVIQPEMLSAYLCTLSECTLNFPVVPTRTPFRYQCNKERGSKTFILHSSKRLLDQCWNEFREWREYSSARGRNGLRVVAAIFSGAIKQTRSSDFPSFYLREAQCCLLWKNLLFHPSGRILPLISRACRYGVRDHKRRAGGQQNLACRQPCKPSRYTRNKERQKRNIHFALMYLKQQKMEPGRSLYFQDGCSGTQESPQCIFVYFHNPLS